MADTHVVIWWLTDDAALGSTHGRLLDAAVADRDLLGVSAMSLWEIAMLGSRGRLRLTGSVDTLLDRLTVHPAIAVLPLSVPIVLDSTRLGPGFPRDPADQLIAATARVHGLRLVTADTRIRGSGVVSVA